MDDVTRARLDGEIQGMHVVVDAAGEMFDAVQGLPTTALEAEIVKLGIPTEANTAQGFHWAGYVIGSMAGKGCSAADCHAVLDAIAEVQWRDSYDVCCEEIVADRLDALPSGCEVEHRYDVNDVYRWARFFRVAVNEVAFGLGDYFDDPKGMPQTELLARAVAGIGFLIDTLHPYARTVAS